MKQLKEIIDHKSQNIKSLQEAAKVLQNDIQEYKKAENTYKKFPSHQDHDYTKNNMINAGASNQISHKNNHDKKFVKQYQCYQATQLEE